MKKATGTKKWIRLSMILYIVILSGAAVFTLAWFVFDETATIKTADNMQITAGTKLEIALVEDGKDLEWGQLIACNTPTTLPDITGNGSVFYFPKVLTEDDNTFDSADTFYKITDASSDKNSYFITVHLRFRTTLPMEVYLSEDSFVSGLSANLVGENVDNKSIFGDFSRDGIAGAVRVAFIEKDPTAMEEYTLKNIWIPNDKYQITYTDDQAGNEVDHKAEFTTDGAREYTILDDGTKQFQYGYMAESGENMTFIPWTLDDYTSHRVTLDSQSLAVHNDGGTQWINDAAPLITFYEDDFKEGIAERELIIKIWIEGTDREADKAFTDGQLKYNFSFVGINKESFESSNAELNAKKIVSDGQKLYYQMGETREEIVTSNLLQYSYNGIDWNSYSGLLEAEGNSSYKYVYVRYAEKLNVKASKPIYVEFTN